jgi:hypothetical protein
LAPAVLSGCAGEVKVEGQGAGIACASMENRDGSCRRDDGSLARIVDRDHSVRLRQLTVRLLHVKPASAIRGPRGTLDAGPGNRFVLIELAVADAPAGPRARFANPKRQVFLYVDGREYRQQLAAERLFLKRSFVRVGPIEPGGRAQASVAFRLPRREAARLGNRSAHPELGIVNFDEAGALQPREWGFIRLTRRKG